MISAPDIILDDMAVTLSGRSLLRPISLQIPAGIWCGVIGPNGGGKSTLLKAITGLVEHLGQITLHWPGQGPGRIGYLPQRLDLDAAMPITVLDYLRLHGERRPVWRRPKPENCRDRLIQQLDIEPFAKQRIGSLSMGQHQRVMLCAALCTSPQLLVLDEPLAGVDETGRKILLEALADFHDRGGTIVMVEHHWEVISAHCQEVLWIEGGLVGKGSADEIFVQLRHRISPVDGQISSTPMDVSHNG